MPAEPFCHTTDAAPTFGPLLVDEREARRVLGGLCAKTMYNLRRSVSCPA